MKSYLVHHGIKGQKWGHRRWQYEDGEYNAAGKVRYGIGDGKDYTGVHQSGGGAKAKSSNENDQEPQQKKGLSDKAKRNLKIAGIAVGATVATAAAGYAAYKLVGKNVLKDVNTNNSSLHDVADTVKSKGRDAVDAAIRKAGKIGNKVDSIASEAKAYAKNPKQAVRDVQNGMHNLKLDAKHVQTVAKNKLNNTLTGVKHKIGDKAWDMAYDGKLQSGLKQIAEKNLTISSKTRGLISSQFAKKFGNMSSSLVRNGGQIVNDIMYNQMGREELGWALRSIFHTDIDDIGGLDAYIS